MSMAGRGARKACLFAPLASRYIAKKIEAIEPKRGPPGPGRKLASGRATLRVMSMAERVARKACLFAPVASRYIAKKIEAIEPKRVPTAPERKLASGRSTAGGTGGALPGGRVDIHRE